MTMMSAQKRPPRPVAAEAKTKQRRPRRRPNPWNPLGPVLVGVCFGLAYVVTGRLLDDRLGGLVPLGRRFASKPVPGLTLESLRMRYGAERVNLLGPAPELLPEPEPVDAAVLPAPEIIESPELPLVDPLEDLPPWPLPMPQPPSSSATVGAPPPVWR